MRIRRPAARGSTAPRDRRAGTVGSLAFAALLAVALAGVAGARADGRDVALSREQQRTVLDEALAAADQAAELRGKDPAAAERRYREAAEKFQLLVGAGVRNGPLFYNLANAELELGEIGRAIADYRRAERYMPGDGRLEHNLRYARSLRRTEIAVAGQQAAVETIFFWHYRTALRTRLWAAAALYVAFWGLLALRLRWRRFAWPVVLVPLAVAALTLSISVALDLRAQARPHAGVLVANDVVVRKGNGEGYAAQFAQKLFEGVEFRVLDHLGDWLQIELPDGHTGWIRREQAELL